LVAWLQSEEAEAGREEEVFVARGGVDRADLFEAVLVTVAVGEAEIVLL
jgi:hypothetical protein